MYGTLEEKSKIEGQSELCGRPSANEKWTNKSNITVKQRRRISSHCHVQEQTQDSECSGDDRDSSGLSQGDKSARKRLITASIICLVFMVAEIVGGIYSNSLAIATDAAHLLTDFSSFMISLFALWLAARPASKRMSFGWYRAEVIGALISVLMIWFVTGFLVYLAAERLRSEKFELDTTVMVITASAGLLVNIIMALALHVDGHSHFGHSHANHQQHSHQVHVDNEDDERENVLIASQPKLAESLAAAAAVAATRKLAADVDRNNHLVDRSHESCARFADNGNNRNSSASSGTDNINVRAAFIHVIGDFLQSLGVLIAALVIHFEPSYAIVDPICTFLFSFIVLLTTLNIIRDAVNILMEGMPDGINFLEVQKTLHSLPHVLRVHNLRIWSLSLDKIALSTHLVINGKETSSSETLKLAIRRLRDIHNFYEVTIQVEDFKEEMRDCRQCRDDSSAALVINTQPTSQNHETKGIHLNNKDSQSLA